MRFALAVGLLLATCVSSGVAVTCLSTAVTTACTEVIGDVTFSSQATDQDVAPYTNVEVFKGSLTLDECNLLTSLSPLANTVTIEGSLTMNNLEAHLNGLAGLQTVFGSLTLNGGIFTGVDFPNLATVASLIVRFTASLTSLSGLSQLQTIADSLIVDSNAAITSLNGLSRLSSIANDFFINNNPELLSWTTLNDISTLSGTYTVTNCPKLVNILNTSIQTIGGSLIVKDNAAMTSVQGHAEVSTVLGDVILENLPSLTTLSTMRVLTTVGGSLTLNNLPLLADINGGFYNLDSVNGSFTVTLLDIVPDLNFNKLKSVGGHLTISNCDGLTRLSQFELLTTIGGNLVIEKNPLLTNITTFNALSSVSAILIIENPAITQLGSWSFTSLSSASNLVVSDNSALESIFAFAPLLEIKGGLDISRNVKLVSAPGPGSLNAIGGGVLISDNSLLTQLPSFDSLNYIGNSFVLRNLSLLTSVPAFSPSLTTISGSLQFEDCPALVSFFSFDLLTTIAGSLVFHNTKLSTILHFPSLTTIGGSLTVTENAALTSVAGFPSLTSVSNAIVFANNSVLETLGHAATPSLLTVHSNSIELSELPSLTTTELFSKVINISDSLVLRSLDSLKTLSPSFDNVLHIGGVLSIENNDVLQEVVLLRRGLLSIGSGVSIVDNPDLCLDPAYPFTSVVSPAVESISSGNRADATSTECSLRYVSAHSLNDSTVVETAMIESVSTILNSSFADNTTANATLTTLFVSLKEISSLVSGGGLGNTSTTTGNLSDSATAVWNMVNALTKPSFVATLKQFKLNNDVGSLTESLMSGLANGQACGEARNLQLDSVRSQIRRQAFIAGTLADPGGTASVFIPSTFDNDMNNTLFGKDTDGCYGMQLTVFENPYESSLSSQASSLIDSDVVSLSVASVNVAGVPDRSRLRFTIYHKSGSAAPPTGSMRQCVFWDDDESLWSKEGCVTLASTDPLYTECQCNHLTNFAVLFDTSGSLDSSDTVLVVFTYVGCILSMIGCFILVVTFLLLPKLRTGPIVLIMHLSVAIFLVNLVFLVGIDRTSNRAGCETVAILLYYFLMASFTWMACIGHNMWSGFTSSWRKGTKYYAMVGWGLPALLTIIVVIIEHSAIDSIGLGNTSRCWISSKWGLIGAFLIPVGIVILINVCVFARSAYILHESRKISSKLQQRRPRMQLYREHFAVSATLVVSLGLTWTFGYLAVISGLYGFYYPFVVFNSLQGLLLCIAYCFRRRVRAEWSYWWVQMTRSSLSAGTKTTSGTPGKTKTKTKSGSGSSNNKQVAFNSALSASRRTSVVPPEHVNLSARPSAISEISVFDRRFSVAPASSNLSSVAQWDTPEKFVMDQQSLYDDLMAHNLSTTESRMSAPRSSLGAPSHSRSRMQVVPSALRDDELVSPARHARLGPRTSDLADLAMEMTPSRTSGMVPAQSIDDSMWDSVFDGAAVDPGYMTEWQTPVSAAGHTSTDSLAPTFSRTYV